MRVLVVNAGSSTLKLALVEVAPGEPAATAARHAAAEVETTDAARAVEEGLERLAEATDGLAFDAVAHRVVHGGRRTVPAVVDDAVVADIQAAGELAPLHNAPALRVLDAARRRIGDVPHVAVFDTGFFAPLPPIATSYGIPPAVAEAHGLRRHGFHGLAHRWMAERMAELAPDRDRLVTLQLGSGCSAAAVTGGRPADTSMGLTPLEGLLMRTRSGDLDPSLPLLLIRRAGMTVDEVEELLVQDSGLAGMTGTDGDVRTLIEAEAEGDETAEAALDLFCYRIRKQIGAYAAAMGGLDAVVFGGGIGEHQPAIRARALTGLDFLGLAVDSRANAMAVGSEARISRGGPVTEVWVVPVDEAAVAAADTATLLG